MARKRMEAALALQSWEEVNEALRQIAAAEIALSDIEGALNRQMDGAKKNALREARPHQDRIAKLSKDVQAFADHHRADLGRRKTRKLPFGSVGYRLSTSVVPPSSKDKPNFQRFLKRLRICEMEDCILVKESVDRKMLRLYGPQIVTGLGAKWVERDSFWYETDHTKLEQTRE